MNPEAGRFQCAGQPLNNPTGAVSAVKVFNGGLWVGAEQGITCFDLNTLQPKGTIPSTAGVAEMIEFEGYILVAFKNGEVRIFDGGGSQTYLHPPQGEHTTNTAVALMTHPFANKPMLLCGQQYGYVTVYDLPEFRPRGTFVSRERSDIRAIVDAKADGMFLTAGNQGDIMVWQWQRQGGGGPGLSHASPFAAGAPPPTGPIAASPFAGAGGCGGGFAGGAAGGCPGGAGRDLMMG